MTTEALITPKVLEWARKRYNLTREAVAKTLNVSPTKVAAWETGHARPTFHQAERLAHRLKVPFGYLYLSHPPIESLPLPDLRTKTGMPPREPSPNFLAALHDAQRKQQWYREEMEAEGIPPLPFVGRFSTDDIVMAIAADIQNTLGINGDMRRNARTWEDFMRDLARKAEDVGILVLRTGVVEGDNNRKLDADEFRGFAIADDLAPLIFVNGEDWVSAQIFTLAHELAHLWINKSGISNPNYRLRAAGQDNPIERLCNRIAADVLVPQEDFLRLWQEPGNIQALAARYRVSKFTVLRQAFDLGKLEQDTYWELYDLERERDLPKPTGKGGDFYNSLLSRNSRIFTAALMVAIAEGRASQLDAANLLHLHKDETFQTLRAHLFGGQPPNA